MSTEEKHITPYLLYGKVLVVLLFLTSITILATWLHLGAYTVALALAIACIKVYLVLTYFMHLKFDEPIFKWFVLGVFILFAIVIVITFLDYLFR